MLRVLAIANLLIAVTNLAIAIAAGGFSGISIETQVAIAWVSASFGWLLVAKLAG